MSTRIEDKIVDGVQVVVNSTLNNINLDKTIKAIIVELVDKNTNKYKVRYQDAQFYAYAIDNRIYSKNTYVYIRIPNGDMSNTKTIISKVNEEEKYSLRPYGKIDIFCRFNSLNKEPYINKNTETEVILYQEDEENNILKDAEYWGKNIKIYFIGVMSFSGVMEVVFDIEPIINITAEQSNLALADYGFKIWYTDSSNINEYKNKKNTFLNSPPQIQISMNQFVGNPYLRNQQNFFYNVIGGPLLDIDFYIRKIVFYKDEELKDVTFVLRDFNLYGTRKISNENKEK